MTKRSDRTPESTLTWGEWLDILEQYHTQLRDTVPGFEGYGDSILASTGEDCWEDYWHDGYSPAGALDEDMEYWG
ncbi:hypothetical protein [Komagataeibacter intermedius]|uniref:Uncharacterized protein n=1 Tax=Komagataeibacter intermedius NRIC 0521 TaxID=1307934 RepID=A0ABQ0PHL1_9PROT|nr:hypothetical protein [Komagataeibacter intermedius]GAN86397.1 hypothetical protein Gain_0027_072 [Komagataeibacter intermedius TF2]GBQ68102.1 hypothetical protein AA0521_1155 [Komagataeibacter intermedius NRIC 0521]